MTKELQKIEELNVCLGRIEANIGFGLVNTSPANVAFVTSGTYDDIDFGIAVFKAKVIGGNCFTAKLRHSDGAEFPCILVPDTFISLKAETQKFMFLHEVGHIKNGHLKGIGPIGSIINALIMRPLGAISGVGSNMEFEADKYANNQLHLNKISVCEVFRDFVKGIKTDDLTLAICKREIEIRVRKLFK